MNDGIIWDRFIPAAASRQSYHVLSQVYDPSPSEDSNSQQHRPQEEALFNMNNTTVNEGAATFRPGTPMPQQQQRQRQRQNNSSNNINNLSEFQHLTISDHRTVIADALSFGGSSNRVLNIGVACPRSGCSNTLNSHLPHHSRSTTPNNYNNNSSSSSSPHNSSSSSYVTSILDNYASPNILNASGTSSSSTSPSSPRRNTLLLSPQQLKKQRLKAKYSKTKRIKSQVPFRVLDAPYLKNDFYSNLVSWSKKSNNIAVGLSSNVYLWSENDGASLLELNENENVTCVSFSNDDLILVGTKTGSLSLFSQKDKYLVNEYHHSGHIICYISWFPNSSDKIFVGDEAGQILFFKVEFNQISQTFELNLKSKFKANQQQVCGIAINEDHKQVSIGGNDNCCTIWDIKDVTNPKLLFFLPHHAAVKAIAYCPWSKSLLATGGGCKDRTIRFWHTQTGTLLSSFQTQGQITSLIWSEHKKQIAATFGFSDFECPALIIVYSYPKMEPIIQVNATPNLRVLTAVLSPNSGSICVTANDETVRFYEIWDENSTKIIESQGIFGSELIELSEGIIKNGGSLR